MSSFCSQSSLAAKAVSAFASSLEQFTWAKRLQSRARRLQSRLESLSQGHQPAIGSHYALCLHRFAELGEELERFLSRFLRTNELNDNITPLELRSLRGKLRRSQAMIADDQIRVWRDHHSPTWTFKSVAREFDHLLRGLVGVLQRFIINGAPGSFSERILRIQHLCILT